MRAEPCLDARLTLGAALSSLASALVDAAWPGWPGVGLMLVASAVLFALAAHALRSRAPVIPRDELRAADTEPTAVQAAVRALGG